MTKPISRYPIADIERLPDDLREVILAIQARTGFVPNVFLALSHRPDELRAFMAYHDALMEREGGLSKADREMVVVATSANNDCQYCVVAHGAILRIRAKDLRRGIVTVINRQSFRDLSWIQEAPGSDSDAGRHRRQHHFAGAQRLFRRFLVLGRIDDAELAAAGVEQLLAVGRQGEAEGAGQHRLLLALLHVEELDGTAAEAAAAAA